MSHEESWFHTPNMDKLAAQGIKFSNAFVESSVCAVILKELRDRCAVLREEEK
jgi:hypothetical protein